MTDKEIIIKNKRANKNIYKIKELEVKLNKYKQALNEIEQEIHSLGSLITIQDIISKAKEGN